MDLSDIVLPLCVSLAVVCMAAGVYASLPEGRYKFDVARTAWPKTEADWRQTSHGAPWDSNVEMARFTLRLYARLTPILAK